MQPLHQIPLTQITENQESAYLKNLKKAKDKIMVSPCNHKFHIACLLEWMSVKMECPTCRNLLPPI